MKEWFKSDTPIEAIDLIRKMLHFNQQKRISIVDALKHTYLSQFSNPKEEFASKRSINLPISDNRKLNLKQYKQLIYQRIRKIYSAETAEASVEKRISYSLQKPKEVLK